MLKAHSKAGSPGIDDAWGSHGVLSFDGFGALSAATTNYRHRLSYNCHRHRPRYSYRCHAPRHRYSHLRFPKHYRRRYRECLSRSIRQSTTPPFHGKSTKSIEGFIKEVHLSFAHVEGAYAKDGVKGEAHAHMLDFLDMTCPAAAEPLPWPFGPHAAGY